MADTGYENLDRRYCRPTASFLESGRIAFDPLSKSNLRSFLTLLGIILATTTLIAVVSFVNGMRHLTPRDDDTLTSAWKNLTGAIAGMASGLYPCFSRWAALSS